MAKKLARDGPLRDMMMPETFYQSLDAGIRFAVRVLHAAGGIETCQSCQGGTGHSYDRPTVDLIAGALTIKCTRRAVKGRRLAQ